MEVFSIDYSCPVVFEPIDSLIKEIEQRISEKNDFVDRLRSEIKALFGIM